MAEPVEIARFESESEAYAAKSLLESRGIGAWVLKDDWGGTKDAFFPFAVKVLLFVAEKDVGQAREIMRDK